jgi:hypothetical protein
MTWEEACRILGVKETVSLEEIREQYRYKAQLLHPDKTIGKPEGVRKKAEEEFKLINQAYEVLTNPLNNPLTHPPKLQISPTRIRFKDVEIGQKKSTTFQINNIGGAYTNIWMDNTPAPWLSITAFKSLGVEGELPMEVTIECTGIGEENKQYSCGLLVRLENEKTQLKDEIALEIEMLIKLKPAVQTPVEQIPSQITPTYQSEFSFGEFFTTLMGYIFIPVFTGLGFIPLIWWGKAKTVSFTIWGIYGVIALVMSIRKGIDEGKKIVHNRKPTTMHSPSYPVPPSSTTTTSSSYGGATLVANRFTMIYHRKSCEWARKISSHNRIYVTKDEARTRGYSPCRVCRP